MTWNLREDLRKEERCYVFKDAAGNSLGYFQEFADNSAGYWFDPMQQATSVRTVFDAKEKLVERYADRFLPLRVFSVEPDGETHLSETFGSSKAYDGIRPVDRVLTREGQAMQDVARGVEVSEAIRRRASTRWFAQRRGPSAFASRPWG